MNHLSKIFANKSKIGIQLSVSIRWIVNDSAPFGMEYLDKNLVRVPILKSLRVREN